MVKLRAWSKTLGRWDFSANPWSMHRAMLRWYWDDESRGSFGLSWGSEYTDPVWWVQTPTFVPPWWMGWLVNLCDQGYPYPRV